MKRLHQYTPDNRILTELYKQLELIQYHFTTTLRNSRKKVMKTPNEIYLCLDAPRIYDWQIKPFKKGGNVEYIRKDIVDETIKTAEDHAYFAGKERLREDLLEWLKESGYENTDRISIQELIDKINSL